MAEHAVQPALEDAPAVLDVLGMDTAPDALSLVVYDLMGQAAAHLRQVEYSRRARGPTLEHIRQTAANHLLKGILESSKMVPAVALNCCLQARRLNKRVRGSWRRERRTIL